MSDRTILDQLNYASLPAVLVSGVLSREEPFGDDPLDELEALAETAGLEVVGKAYQKLENINPRTYIGKGKVAEVAAMVKESGARIVVFDNELRPNQQDALEEEVGVSVLDRTELILAIFGQHTRTRQAKVQVQLAQAEYELPRLKNLWTHLERQRGALGKVGGAGERQIEVDRRLLRDRISALKAELEQINRRRHIEVQRRSDLFQVAIVGYTNAGKSTLMNALTQEGVLAEDKLFATLDTRTCVWKLPDHKVLLSDTVGFIRNLPHRLVASFHATLEEVLQADLLLHVVDASHTSAVEMIEAVNGVLKEIGAGDKRTLMVLNKIDLVRQAPQLTHLQNLHPEHVRVSAKSGVGLTDLERKVQEVVEERETRVDWTFSAGNGKLLAYLKQHGKILNIEYAESEVHVEALIEPRYYGQAVALRDA
ncbi:MAG: GTPase HflX [Planctomycetes bacterium]|nr:GTPase HflX [Planctomycetota bacterium]MCW8134604.1 GTPase HflX [Planctomycetota bacterium]